MATLHVVQVFLGEHGRGGNALGVFLDGGEIPVAERQAVAADLGFSETVFVDDADRGVVRIHTPTVELALAGHPLVGTSWLLRELERPVDVLRPPAGEVPTWAEDDLTWIRGRPEWAPRFDLVQLDSAEAVDTHPGARPDELLEVWAWEDEARGRIRARVFPRAVGIEEDEATGSAALLLGARTGRPIVIRQGRDSVIVARPGADPGTVEVGGRVRLVQERQY